MNLISSLSRLLLGCGQQAGCELRPGEARPLDVRGGAGVAEVSAHLSPRPAHVPALTLAPAPGHDAL